VRAAEPAVLRHALLERAGVPHGFGVRGSVAPAGTLWPRQVHGSAVACIQPGDPPSLAPGEADAVVSQTPGIPIAVVTADCVPILACSEDGRAVAAIHAGWRGLAQGVVEAGIAALGALVGSDTPLTAVIGPHIGICCYEVDEPVLAALAGRFTDELPAASRSAGSAGHAYVDLGRLAGAALGRAGVVAEKQAVIADACTRCGGERFHSYRRDGEAAGRMIHFVAVAEGRKGRR
jgi:YfiH family protein